MATPISFRIFEGENLVATKEFDQDIIKIGRLATAHLKLEDPKVSRIHAVIEIGGGGREVSIIDMGSAEGTFVNGEKINKVKLKDGDFILVGDTKLQVVMGAAAQAGAPAGLAAMQAELQSLGAASPESSGVFARSSLDQALAEPPAPAPAPAAARPPAPVAPPPPPAETAPAPRAEPTAIIRNRPQPPAADPAAPAPRVSSPRAAPVVAPPPAPVMAAEDDDEAEGPYQPPPEPVPDAARAVLELQVKWGHTVIEVQHHDKTPLVTIGPGGDVHLSAEEFAGPARPLFTCKGLEYSLHVTREFKGFVRTQGEGVKELKEIRGEPDAGGMRIPLSPDQSGELTFHNMVLAFRFNEPRRKVIAAPFVAMDYGWLNTLMMTVFMSVAFLATLILYPQDTKSLEEDLFQTSNRFTQFIVNPEKKQKSDFLKKLEAAKNKGAAPAKAANASGKMGQKKEQDKKPDGKVATKADIRKANEEAVNKKIEALFGGGSSSAVFSASANDALENAMGGISGREVGAAYGFGGLGERGHGPGGGGTSTSTFGVGKIGTRGRGGGNSGFGTGTGGLGGKTEHAIDVTQGAPVILGSLDKEIIRRVIRENIQQIKYCYERELTRTPGLAGKVQIKFVIGAQGAVQSAVVAESSMNNKTVESCIAGKVRGWIFPKPKGGGIVIVTYPFIFKQGG
ncbi:MAG: AgmX/PglI C-terminal domain-containing protein [Myxococcota bacterium]